mgnify:FL=1|jgi:hypothetical protein
MSMMFKELRPCYDNLIKNRKFYEQRWKTGKSGAPLPPPQPVISVQRRGSGSNIRLVPLLNLAAERNLMGGNIDKMSSPQAPQRGVGRVTGSLASKYVLAHNVNRARQKFIGYAQKRGSPAKA